MIKNTKTVITVSVTSARPERGASAVKRVKSWLKRFMKMELLNALLMILMNGPTNKGPK